MNAVTVSRGVAELESGDEPLRRARRPGAGRKDITETDPGLVRALLALVDPAARGDPESPLRWTVKSTRSLAGELARQGHKVSDRTVARLQPRPAALNTAARAGHCVTVLLAQNAIGRR